MFDSETYRDIYKNFIEPPLSIDCGKLCREQTGFPLCCSKIIPVLYISEFLHLSSETEIWIKAENENLVDKKFHSMIRQGIEMVIPCNYPGFVCQREIRPISCRTFPFLPFINNIGKVTGLYLRSDFHCPLYLHLELINKEFIRQSAWYWEFLFSKSIREFENYKSLMRGYQISCGRKKIEPQVIYF